MTASDECQTVNVPDFNYDRELRVFFSVRLNPQISSKYDDYVVRRADVRTVSDLSGTL